MHPPADEETGEEELRLIRGCEENGHKQGEPFDFAPDLVRCPWAVIDPVAFACVDAYETWKRIGVLPFGAERVGEMPQWMCEAFDVAARGQDTMRQAAEVRAQNMMQHFITQIGRGPSGGHHGA